jgi:hypothetical protein
MGLMNFQNRQKVLGQSLLTAVAFTTVFSSATAFANTMTYTSDPSFLAAVGSSITDNYSNPGYARSNGPQPTFMTDAVMSAVLGQTTYTDTKFPNQNEVVGPASGGNPYFCSGCNGSVKLGFLSTSLTTNGGVYGVAFNYRDGVPGATGQPYDFLVTFGDGSKTDYTVPASGQVMSGGFATDFFGITSNLEISSIYFGIDGSPSAATVFALDNLTIAGATPVPEPTSMAVFGAALAGLAAVRRRKRPSA